MGGPRLYSLYLLVDLLLKRAGSSVAEQGTFNPRVVGSIPTRLTEIVTRAIKAKIHARATICPHRLVA